MGLDMFAYRIKAELVGDQQVDIDVHSIALQAAGFKVLRDREFNDLSREARDAYFEARDTAKSKAVELGLFDPDFGYWRKFNHLHGWMERLYRSKGGTSSQFNCDTVRLMPQDLDRLESMAKMKALPATEGFFFGTYEDFCQQDAEEVQQFVTKARAAIADGYAVIYDSWW